MTWSALLVSFGFKKIEIPLPTTCLIRRVRTIICILLEVPPIVNDEMVSYERDRLQQIQENNKMLLALVQTLAVEEFIENFGRLLCLPVSTHRDLTTLGSSRTYRA